MSNTVFFKIIRPFAALSIIFLLIGCGGGGGGSSSGSAEEQTNVKISGEILDNNHNPIAYATVTFTSDPVVVNTNQWGEFFAEVSQGDHTITIQKDNVILYKGTFTTEGSAVYLGDLIANYPDTVSPSIPADVIATAQSSSQINLNWSSSTDNVGVTGYQVYRDGSLLKTVTATSTTDTGLSASTQYCYTVKAGDVAGNWSAESTQSCATTPEAPVDNQAPSIPAGVIATAQSSSQINLNWSASTDNVGVTGYQIYRNGILLKAVTGTSTADTGLSASTQYCYTVKAGDAAGNWSADSTQSCATTQALADTQPPTVSITSPTNHAINVDPNVTISATFNENINPSTITAQTFAVTMGTGGISVSGSRSCVGSTVTFTPSSSLNPGTTYTATVTTGIKDLAGNSLASIYNWSFTTGSLTWNKTFGGTTFDDFAYSVQQTSDGGYIVAGITTSYGAGSYDAWLIKTDASGNMVWNKTFGGTNDEGANSVQQTSDGGYIVAGYTSSYGAGSYDAWLIKTDLNGDMVWSKTFGGADWDWANSVQQTSDGGYIVAGSTVSYGTSNVDAWLIKTDANGNAPTTPTP
jgi:chitodextrinase